MRANRRSDIGPERRLRSELHARGKRFRKDALVDLDSVRIRIDIVFRPAKVAAFFDGCFWHRCPQDATDPKRNAQFWADKLARNVERDRYVNSALIAAGWIVIRCWECEAPERAADRVLSAIETRDI